MKKLRKLSALLIAAVMIFAMAVPVMALTPKTDNTDLTITGVEDDEATITAQQVVKAQYNATGDSFEKWVYATGSKDGVAYEVVPADSTKVDDDTHKYLKLNMDGTAPTEQQINAIAKALAEGKLNAFDTKTLAADTSTTAVGDYKVNITAENNAGVYIAKVIPSANDDSQYNPILLAASYDGEGVFGQGSADPSLNNYTSGTAKKTTPKIEKSVTGGTPDNVKIAVRAKDEKGNFKQDASGNRLYVTAEDLVATEGAETTDVNKAKTIDSENEMTGGVGTVLDYTLTPTLPVYPADAINKTLWLADTLSEGLTYMKDSLNVTVEGQTLTRTVADGKITWKDGDKVVAEAKEQANGFHIAFTYENLKDGANGGKVAPIITYKATVNTNAVLSVPGNPNLAEMFYAKNSNDGSTYKDLDSKPSGETYNYKNDEKVIYTYQFAFKKTNDKNEGEEGYVVLADAIFGLYTDEDCTNLIAEIKTNDKGWGFSDQLEKGTYYLKEIQAPTGYQLLPDVTTININWAASTKTTTSTTTHTRTVYTYEVKDAKKDVDGNVKQAGWFVKQSNVWTDAVFAELSAYSAADEAAGKVMKAYVKEYTESTETATTLETFANAGHTYDFGPIKNTQMNQLPSTGGMGTYIFTILGVALIGVAASLLIFKRRKDA